MEATVAVGGDDDVRQEKQRENEDEPTNKEPLLQESFTLETAPSKNNAETKTKEVEYRSNRKGLLAQCIVTAVISVALIGGGMPIGYSAVLLPQLKESNDSLQIDAEMGSWIASIHSAATPIGSLLSGTMMDFFGRKASLQLSCIPLILGWILITVCQNHAVLLIGRVFAGLCVGIVAPSGQVYVAEVSDAHLRGVVGSVPFTSYSFGILLVYMLGSKAHWRLVSGLSIILPAISLITYFFLPESPAWLVRQGKIQQARKSCLWLRGGDTVQAEREIQILIERTEDEKKQKQEGNKEPIWRYFFRAQVMKPFLIVNIFNLLQTASGVYLIVFYAVDIIAAMGVTIDKFLVAMLTGGVRVIFAAVASFLLGITGRRVVGIGSAVSTGISALLLSMFLYSGCQQNGYFTTICLLLYVGANTVGLMMLPGIMVGELYPIRVRGVAGSITFTLFNLMIFGLTKVYPPLQPYFSIADFFTLFGVAALVTAVFIYLFVPETKGISLTDIEDYFLQDNILWLTRNRKGNRKNELCANNNNICEKI